MNAEPESGALACAPGAIAFNERAAHFALAQRLLGESAERGKAIPNGLSFELPADSLLLIAQFVQNERKCCPSAIFEITVGAATEPISLRITGPSGFREMLQAELASGLGCGCGSERSGSKRLARWSIGGGMLAAVGICAACCLLPIGLIVAGVGGALVSAFDSMAPYKGWFAGLIAVPLGYGFYAVYFRARNCLKCRARRWMRLTV